MTLLEFKEKVYLKYNGDIKVIGKEYINNKTPIKVKCLKCGNKRYAIPNKLLTDSKCAICSKKKKRTHEEFKEEIKKLTNNEYFVKSKYMGITKKVTLYHRKCKHQWQIVASNFLHMGNRCPKCSHPSIKKTQEEFEKEISNLTDNEFVCLSKYVNTDTAVEIKHVECGTIFKRLPSNIVHLKTINCPVCHKNESYGIRAIKRFLLKKNIPFVTEKSFKTLKGLRNNKLRFDIYIKSLKLLIEYDGEHHFFTSAFRSAEKLKRARETDFLRNKWVTEKNKSLLRIKYTCSYKMIKRILKNLLEKGSTTIEKYDIYYYDRNTKKTINSNRYYS